MPNATPDPTSLPAPREVASRCLCLHAQRAARALARRFDEAFRPWGVTNGQFSVMTALARPAPWRMGALAAMLAMDRTTLTAALKPLERRGFVTLDADPEDRRARLARLTAEGRALLGELTPLWVAEHARLEAALAGEGAQVEPLRDGLRALGRLAGAAGGGER